MNGPVSSAATAAGNPLLRFPNPDSRFPAPRPEQGRPHPYHRRALGHRQLDVLAHAHRERVDLRMLRGQRIEQRLHADEGLAPRSEEHTSELQSLMRISYAVFCLKKKNTKKTY